MWSSWYHEIVITISGYHVLHFWASAKNRDPKLKIKYDFVVEKLFEELDEILPLILYAV